MKTSAYNLSDEVSEFMSKNYGRDYKNRTLFKELGDVIVDEYFQEYTNGSIERKFVIKIGQLKGFIFKKFRWGVLSDMNFVNASCYYTPKTWNTIEEAQNYIDKILSKKSKNHIAIDYDIN